MKTPSPLQGLAAVIALVAAATLLAAPAAQAAQPRFYLSTDRVFSPEDGRVTVRLEARGLAQLDFRLYRIPDPETFFSSQPDLHRVETQNGPKRASSLDVAAEAWRLASQSVLQAGRGELTAEVRAAGRSAYPDEVERLRVQAETVPPPSTAVPLLKDLKLADRWREDLPSAGPWTYRDVAITARKPGVYLVEAVSGHEVGYTVVIISRLVLLTRQSQDHFLVYAVDPALGTPVADARIRLLRGATALGQGTTDEDGLWHKQIPLERGLTVFARRGEDFALLDPVYHPANIYSRKVYLTTERPVYRPGQEVFFKGIIRDYRDERYRLADPERVKVSVQDANGQQVHEAELEVGRTGSFHGRLKLFDQAALGTYRLVANVEDKEYGGEFKVKAYRKPEYRVRVSTPKRAYVSGQKVTASVAANYFFGPPVAGAKVKVTVYRTRFYIPWWIDADYAWYYSDAEYRNTMRETIEEKEGRLDADGKFQVDFETLADSLDYTYGIEAVVTDVSDQAVTGHGAVRVTKAAFRLVLEPEYLLNAPDQPARVRVISSDYARQPVAAEVDVEVIARQGEDPSSAKERSLLTQKLTTGPKGEAWLTFEPDRGGAYLVRAKADDGSGNQMEASATLYVTEAGGDIPSAPAELEIIADKRSYSVGDKARFLLLTPHADAHLLVTVEGGRLYQHKVLRARGHSAVFELSLEQAQAPNFFLRVATVFDRSLYERRLDVVVPPRKRMLDVEVAASPAEAKPGQKVTFSVRVRDSQGDPVEGAEVALALVDEAIYGISPEIAVPIERFFYHRKRNDVRATCSLDFRFYGYGEDTKDRMAALHLREPVVPGSFKSAAASKMRTEFKDTLAWYPALVTGPDGTASVQVAVPDNLTTWRATARAITTDTRVGQGTGEMRVSKPVVLRIAAPAFLVERDRGKLGLLVHNYTGQTREFRLDLKATGGLELTGEATTVEVKPNRVGVVAWEARATRAGQVELQATAQAGDQGDAVEQTLTIRPYGIEQVLLAGGVLDDERPEAKVELNVPESAAPDSVRASVEVSSGVAPALLSSLEYLAGFPYGCTEQTMSRFLPDLVVAKALGELGMKSRELEDKLPEYIHAGLARLAQLQHPDGGWGWWADDATDPTMTAYVIQGLGLAKRLGWRVDQDMLNRGANRLKYLVRSARLSPTQRAYLLYSLALSGVKYESMLDKLAAKPEGLTDYGKALLAMAMFELGQRDQATALVGQIDQAVHTSPAGAWWGDEQDQPGWQADPIETTAASLRSLLLTKPDSVNIPAAVRWLMSVRQNGRWRSTRDTAMAIFALVDYLKQAGSAEYQASVAGSLNGKAAKPVTIGPDEVFEPSIAMLTDQAGRVGANTFDLKRSGRGALFYNASLTYFGREDPITAKGDKFRIDRKLLAVERQPSGSGWRFTTRPLTGPVRSGQEILVVLELTAAQAADYVMVADPLPAGVQPIDRDRGYKLPGVQLQQPRMHREFGDQQAAFFISHLRRGQRKLAYLVRATLPGDYHALPARVMPMYDPQFAGNSASDRLQVED